MKAQLPEKFTPSKTLCCDLDGCVFGFTQRFVGWLHSQGITKVPFNYGPEGTFAYLTRAEQANLLHRYYKLGEHKSERLVKGARQTLLAISLRGTRVWYVSSRPPIAGPETLRNILRWNLPTGGVLCCGIHKYGVIQALTPTHIIDDDPEILMRSSAFVPKGNLLLIRSELAGPLTWIPTRTWSWIRKRLT